jgi:hypothetical protein
LSLFGQLSDRLGRRRVVALGLGAAVLASVLFALAKSVAWLFVARGVQGAALGATAGTAAAALVELEPAVDAGQAGGAAVVPVLAGASATSARRPTSTSSHRPSAEVRSRRRSSRVSTAASRSRPSRSACSATFSRCSAP